MFMFIISNVVGSTIQITTLPLPVLSTLQAVSLIFVYLLSELPALANEQSVWSSLQYPFRNLDPRRAVYTLLFLRNHPCLCWRNPHSDFRRNQRSCAQPDRADTAPEKMAIHLVDGPHRLSRGPDVCGVASAEGDILARLDQAINQIPPTCIT